MDFKDYQLKSGILKAMTVLGYEHPTKVQEEVIPIVLAEKDLIVKSQTGSGKTAAFVIPLCQKIEWEKNEVQALILTPTRELCMQVATDCFHIGRFERMKVVALYGKAPFQAQQKALKQKTHLVVGTPGRVLDHLQRGTLDVSHIRYLVIDEADEMLRMGFIEQVATIIEALPRERCTLLFSATYSPEIETLCEKYMHYPQQVVLKNKKLTADLIEEVGCFVEKQDKIQALMKWCMVEQPESCMIFANTKEQVDVIYSKLKDASYGIVKLHGGMEQKDRFTAMEDFRKGRFRYLVATDVAARGIDIDHVTHVVNIDMPENKEYYVHRIGRTGRGGRKGKAISFISSREQELLKSLESYMGHAIKIQPLPNEACIALHEKSFKEKMQQAIVKETSTGEKFHKEIMKLHINAGKKTKMRPVDIVGTLCNLKGMTAQDIGIIDVQDISTFVEILNNKGEDVYKQLQTTPIKGRMRRVSKVDR